MPSHRFGSFSHPDQPEVPGVCCNQSAWIKAASIIDNRDTKLLFVEGHEKLNGACPGMVPNVRQRFPDDPYSLVLDGLVQRSRSALNRELEFRTEVPGGSLHGCGECGREISRMR